MTGGRVDASRALAGVLAAALVAGGRAEPAAAERAGDDATPDRLIGAFLSRGRLGVA
jgi:hypothetical protein